MDLIESCWFENNVIVQDYVRALGLNPERS